MANPNTAATAAKKTASKKTAAKKATTKKAPAKKASAANGATKAAPRRSSKKDAILIHGVAPYKPTKKEEYMGPKMLEHFRQILEGWRSELKNETDRTVNHMQDETANHPDPTDRASQETDMALELRGRDRDRKLIKKIEESIAFLKSGDFGYCESCGVEIGLKRLEARPTASLCIDCKTIDEIREKQLS